MRKLTDDHVTRIRALRTRGWSAERIAREIVDVSASSVGRVVRGEHLAPAVRPELDHREPRRDNERAARAAIRAMRRAGRVDDADRALITAFVSLAQAVDASPRTAALWREYLTCAVRLRERYDGTGIGAVDDLRDRMRLALHRT